MEAYDKSERETIAALRKIKSMKVDILSDKVRVCSLLNDIAPELKRERRRIRCVYETGAIKWIAAAISSDEEAAEYLARAAEILTNSADMKPYAAAQTVNYYSALWFGLPRLKYDGAEDGAESSDDFDQLDGGAEEPGSSFGDAVSVSGALQLEEKLSAMYDKDITSAGKESRAAALLGRLAMKALPLSAGISIKLFGLSVKKGGAEQLSLFGRHILAWPQIMPLQPSFGFFCVKKAVEMGAKRGCLSLGYCYHNAVGAPRCPALAEKYYLMSSATDEKNKERALKYLNKLRCAEEYDDGRWQFG